MDLPGKNTITLCMAALQKMIEKSINDARTPEQKRIRVEWIDVDLNQHTVSFVVTTDERIGV